MTHTRTRTGCLTCRDDGYKCDEGKPTCGRCIRLGKTCKGYGLRVRWRVTADASAGPPKVTKRRSPRSKGVVAATAASSSQKGASASSPPTPHRPGPAPGMTLIRNPSSLPPDVTPTDRLLLHHWTTSLAGVVSMASHNQNPFLVHLTPMMLRSDALRFAVSSMAAGHLAVLRCSSSSSSEMRALASRHMLHAVSSLRSTIQAADPQLSLAAILMLQISDRLLGTDSRVDHLAGAKAVIAHSGGPAAWTTAAARFLLSLCFYHDVMSSVSRAAKPLLAGAAGSIAPLEDAQSLARLTELVSVVGAISRMQGQSGPAHQRRGFAIREPLLRAEDPVADSDMENTIQAYRHAAVIYLYRVWDDDTTTAPPPKPAHARECIRHLLQVPVSSPSASAHAWPLWTAGCESVDPEPRGLVLERLKEMYQSRKLPSLLRAQEDMREVWAAKDAARREFGTEDVDCCKMILHNRHREADLV
ncbi:fungal Zn binuclear cluster domain containing protein [Colletotrichum musicola]|uniref:Fungal Zn binuclear cluster domain containing protein n=1 Tax=Colletotrichum musicola TaxID=2175873 RepID=A0A8H6NCM2_9PEZI|nr:fungal Zn binuclear cluster domain containing protein [Colletotrichum musicola]